MALTPDLPIYKHGCKLLELALRVEAQLPRTFKRSLGERVHRLCMDMLEDMAVANAARGQARVDALDALLQHLRSVTALLRVGHDMRAPHPLIAKPLWSEAVEILDTVGGQAGGWRREALNGLKKVPAA
jgi:hypothetical protein